MHATLALVCTRVARKIPRRFAIHSFLIALLKTLQALIALRLNWLRSTIPT